MVVGDSWFASYETAAALRKEMDLFFVGNIKTAHAHFPIEQMRWDLASTSRGDHTVYKLRDSSVPCHAIAWNDYHYKTFVTTGGTSEPGTDAKRKRQDEHGTTTYKHVKRCKVLQDYYTASGFIDLHNRHRQGTLQLEKIWKTKKWNNRVTVSILSSCMVDAFMCWERYFPTPESDKEVGSNLKSFVAKVIDEIRPDPAARVQGIGGCDRGCTLEPIGKYEVTLGKNKGKLVTKQERCTVCSKNGYRPDRGRAPRTAFRCKKHPDVYVCATHKRPCLQQHVNDSTREIHAV